MMPGGDGAPLLTAETALPDGGALPTEKTQADGPDTGASPPDGGDACDALACDAASALPPDGGRGENGTQFGGFGATPDCNDACGA